MIVDINQSIAAIATPPGHALRGVVRLSGPQISTELNKCFEADDGVKLSKIRRPAVISGRIITGDLLGEIPIELFFWPTSSSYTRQSSAEIHVLGAAPILDEIIRVLQHHGVRQAQPGEFTLRAFLAGRIDLTRAEAVLGVIDAASEQEMRVALQQLSGGLSGPIETVREELLNVLSQIEAGLDFADEDIEFITRDEVAAAIHEAADQLGSITQQIKRREIAESRFRTVLVGRENAGKSCLLNALTDEQTSLVSDLAGTTRDYVVGLLRQEGITVEVLDTAGLHPSAPAYETNGPTAEAAVLPDRDDNDVKIQAYAQAMSRSLSATAHLKLLCIDGSRQPDAWEENQLLNPKSSTVVVQTKTDLPAKWTSQSCHRISSLTGDGISELRKQIFDCVSVEQSTSDLVQSTASRCVESIHRAVADIQLAERLAAGGEGDEVLAAQIRSVLEELGVITGRIYTDDILDRVFSRFCIGK